MSKLGKPSTIAILLILTAGVAAISSSAILIRFALKAAAQDGLGISLLIAATRLSMATLLLLPIAYGQKLRSSKRSPPAKLVKSSPSLEYNSSQDLPLALTDSQPISQSEPELDSEHHLEHFDYLELEATFQANLPTASPKDALSKPQPYPKTELKLETESPTTSQSELATNQELGKLPTPALLMAIASGVLLAMQFCTWTTSLSYTSIAASTTLVTTNPIWTALIGWLWGKEGLSRVTWLGMAIAFGGGVLIAQADGGGDIGSNPGLGNSLALLGAIAMSLYLHLAQRAQKAGLSLNTHITIAYGTAALVLLPLPFLTQTYYWHFSPQFYGYILLLAIAPQLIGHTSLNWSLRWTSPTVVAVVILCEPVLASLWGYLFLSEAVAGTTIVGAILILVGVAVSIWKL